MKYEDLVGELLDAQAQEYPSSTDLAELKEAMKHARYAEVDSRRICNKISPNHPEAAAVYGAIADLVSIYSCLFTHQALVLEGGDVEEQRARVSRFLKKGLENLTALAALVDSKPEE